MYTHTHTRKHANTYPIQFALWGNKSDLSLFQHLSVEDAKRMQGTDSAHLASSVSKILVNDTERCVSVCAL